MYLYMYMYIYIHITNLRYAYLFARHDPSTCMSRPIRLCDTTYAQIWTESFFGWLNLQLTTKKIQKQAIHKYIYTHVCIYIYTYINTHIIHTMEGWIDNSQQQPKKQKSNLMVHTERCQGWNLPWFLVSAEKHLQVSMCPRQTLCATAWERATACTHARAHARTSVVGESECKKQKREMKKEGVSAEFVSRRPKTHPSPTYSRTSFPHTQHHRRPNKHYAAPTLDVDAILLRVRRRY